MASSSNPSAQGSSPYWLTVPAEAPTSTESGTSMQGQQHSRFDVLSIPGAREVLAPLGTAPRPPAGGDSGHAPPATQPVASRDFPRDTPSPNLSPHAKDHPIALSFAEPAFAEIRGYGWGNPGGTHPANVNASAAPAVTSHVPPEAPIENASFQRPTSEPQPIDPRQAATTAATGPSGLASGTPAMIVPFQLERPDLLQPRAMLETAASPHSPALATPMLQSQPSAVHVGDRAGMGSSSRFPADHSGASSSTGVLSHAHAPSASTGGAPPETSDGALSPDASLPYFAVPATAPTPVAPVSASTPQPVGVKQSASHRAPKGEDKQLSQNALRKDFPILRRMVRGKQLVWLDSSATAQKPQEVIDRISVFYEDQNSNVHRGSHDLADEATSEYEAARKKVQRFLGASRAEEIVFTRGCTESINLVANAFGGMVVGRGDQILVSELEHHSNIVPWKFLADRVGAVLRPIPINDRGEVKLSEYQALLTRNTKIVAFTQVSNSLGTILPVEEMTEQAHRAGAFVVIDGAQSVPHFAVNVQELGCDFFTFSGHKLFGPSGVGALWGRKELLDRMPPWQGGGSMIESVSFDEVVFAPVPAKFEAGTPILAGAVGLGAAIDYVDRIGMAAIAAHDQELLTHAIHRLRAIPGVKIVAEPARRTGAVSFVVNNFESREVGLLLNDEGIAVRAGHHCAQPSLAHFGLKASVRPSFALYNTLGEVDLLADAVTKIARSRN